MQGGTYINGYPMQSVQVAEQKWISWDPRCFSLPKLSASPLQKSYLQPQFQLVLESPVRSGYLALEHSNRTLTG
jgi:hypothetical protein